MSRIEEIRSLYENYIDKVMELERKRKPTDGLLGFGTSPSQDPCHDAFADELEKELAAFTAGNPGSAETAEILEYMIRIPTSHEEPKSVYWMLLAVHSLAIDLTKHLDREDAKRLAAIYAKLYPRWERLPNMTKLLKALK